MKRRALPIVLLVLLALASPLLLAFAPRGQGGGIIEPWATVIFVILVPLIVQAVKWIADKKGKEIATYVAQTISVVLAFLYVLVSGGFAGLLLPIFPAWAADIWGFVVGFLTFCADWIRLLLIAAGAIEIAYRLVLKVIFEKLGFATKAALAERAASAGP
jgi:CDP-diglyceride synthetase